MELIKSVSAAGTSAVLAVNIMLVTSTTIKVMQTNQASYCIRHPIDVIKTRLQVSSDGLGVRNYRALGIGGTMNVIATEEGVRAFWKGIGKSISLLYELNLM